MVLPYGDDSLVSGFIDKVGVAYLLHSRDWLWRCPAVGAVDSMIGKIGEKDHPMVNVEGAAAILMNHGTGVEWLWQQILRRPFSP